MKKRIDHYVIAILSLSLCLFSYQAKSMEEDILLEESFVPEQSANIESARDAAEYLEYMESDSMSNDQQPSNIKSSELADPEKAGDVLDTDDEEEGHAHFDAKEAETEDANLDDLDEYGFEVNSSDSSFQLDLIRILNGSDGGLYLFVSNSSIDVNDSLSDSLQKKITEYKNQLIHFYTNAGNSADQNELKVFVESIKSLEEDYKVDLKEVVFNSFNSLLAISAIKNNNTYRSSVEDVQTLFGNDKPFMDLAILTNRILSTDDLKKIYNLFDIVMQATQEQNISDVRSMVFSVAVIVGGFILLDL